MVCRFLMHWQNICPSHELLLGEIVEIVEQCSKFADESGGLVSYEELLDILQKSDNQVVAASEGPDMKVVEFMRILEEYRVKCEEEGNYLEAGRAHKQLEVLRIQEEKRQQKAIKVRQITERQDVQVGAKNTSRTLFFCV